ncbi:cytochrome P450 [Actinomadura logoneensis]|uniref:Cytochrome P450 n=1 Tax=Actinomadura logoneensis TaxID=2293572 RepID=A0A372JI64_9ACTN|nr:cytochrome P450 [Actinomadura logoneensis]RFU39650.1 cytochrome P450 [Actinomadura logoneensis]
MRASRPPASAPIPDPAPSDPVTREGPASDPAVSDAAASGPATTTAVLDGEDAAVTILPTRRDHPFDPPSELGLLRDEGPVTRLAFPDGARGWLLTRHEDVRAVLADGRFSADRIGASSPVRRPEFRAEDRPGVLVTMDPPEHTRLRRMLTPYFTTRRMQALAPRVERIATAHLDALRASGPPADLVPTYTLPIPSLVICELLGVPYADRARFHAWAAAALSLTTSDDEVRAARDALTTYMRELVAAKRREPDDALLGALVTGDNDLTDAELCGIGRLLLVAGHETTANQLALGALTLITRPDQLAVFRERRDAADRAVEELLRYLTIIQFGTTRVAREDVVLHGRRVRRGETVVLSLPAANRDPGHFDRPDELDVTRPPSQHVAFGHGIHQCLGQQLARVEMRIALTVLFDGLRELSLAVPADRIPMRHDMAIYGVHRLPVSWKE